MKLWCLPLACVLASSAAAADNCEALRADIEARIRAAGVASLSVTIVDAAAPTTGKIVGGCDMGRRKIVYEQLGAPAPALAPAPAQAPATAPRARPPVLTECRDGSTPVDGRCKK